VSDKVSIDFTDIGEQILKNIARSIRVDAVGQSARRRRLAQPVAISTKMNLERLLAPRPDTIFCPTEMILPLAVVAEVIWWMQSGVLAKPDPKRRRQPMPDHSSRQGPARKLDTRNNLE
jgi:hypothetical protein